MAWSLVPVRGIQVNPILVGSKFVLTTYSYILATRAGFCG